VVDTARAYLRRPGEVRAGTLVAAEAPLADILEALPAPGEPAALSALTASGVDQATALDYLAARRRGAATDVGPVRSASGRPVADVVHALDAVGLDGTLEAVAGLVATALEEMPPPDRFRVWQARAVLDDLRDWRRGAATAALAAPGPAEELVQAWLHTHREALRRAEQIAVAPRRRGGDLLARADLCRRRLQAVVTS